jgi:hypothetical protein
MLPSLAPSSCSAPFGFEVVASGRTSPQTAGYSHPGAVAGGMPTTFQRQYCDVQNASIRKRLTESCCRSHTDYHPRSVATRSGEGALMQDCASVHMWKTSPLLSEGRTLYNDAGDEPSGSQFKQHVKDMFATSSGRYAKAAWRHAIAAVPEVRCQQS